MTIPGNVDKALKEFHHELSRKHQVSPYICTPIIYGAGAQVIKVPEGFKNLEGAGNKFV